MAENWNLFKAVHAVIGDHPSMIFGKTGTGKSMFCRCVAQSAVNQGIKVAVCDTEANYIEEDIKWFSENCAYSYVAGLTGVITWIKNVHADNKLIILDSIGGPGYGEYTKAGMKQSGDIFQRIAGICFDIQQHCLNHNAMAITVNQPISEMVGPGGKKKEVVPFGGKSGFYVKEVLYSSKLSFDEESTLTDLVVNKSRHMPNGFVFARMRIDSEKVAIRLSAYQGRKQEMWGEISFKVPNPQINNPPKKPSPEPEAEAEEEEESESEQETEETTPEDDGADFEVDEDEEEDEASDLGSGEQVALMIAAIKETIKEKEMGELGFKAMMRAHRIDIKSPDDIKDVDMAVAVGEAVAQFGLPDDEIPF